MNSKQDLIIQLISS